MVTHPCVQEGCRRLTDQLKQRRFCRLLEALYTLARSKPPQLSAGGAGGGGGLTAEAADAALAFLTHNGTWLGMIAAGATATMEVRQRRFCAGFRCKTIISQSFPKTGSGHTQRRLQKKRPFGCTFSQVWTTKDKPNLSWSHPWCSAPANIVPRRLMGVQPLAPGYVHFEVYPQPAQLAWATLSLPTTRGKILLRFNQTASVFNASLTIPQGSTARVCLPPPTATQVRGKRSDFAPFSFGSETILCPDRLGTTQYET